MPGCQKRLGLRYESQHRRAGKRALDTAQRYGFSWAAQPSNAAISARIQRHVLDKYIKLQLRAAKAEEA